MSGLPYDELARHWAGLPLLVRLAQEGTELSSETVATILGARSVKGIGASLSGTRFTLGTAGIRMEEATVRRTVRGRSVWTAGPRIRQAMHVLEQERYKWTVGSRKDLSAGNAKPGEKGPVLVLRALKCRGNVYRIYEGMAELDEILDDESFWIEDAGRGSVGEIFVAGIEPGEDGREHPVPDGFGENGIWVRGAHDYDEPRVPGAIGTGRFSTMVAWIGEATWVERRLPLQDVHRQVAMVRADNSWRLSEDAIKQWRDVEPDTRFRYVSWIGARGLQGPSHAPPLRMRLRRWHEVVIGTKPGQRIVLREEGLRGDDARTTRRAVENWARRQGIAKTESIMVQEFRIARKQPRPIDPEPTDCEGGAVPSEIGQ
ncbi:MAG: hypothetical protein F4Y60_11840 [Boseongicola sp. SB0664_bin_43]|uniref:Uncharacterized protein n=1 Tax=Boseongicola sp. SB0664_bin_43 TaxID=2604844 RepID=A0A6B0Y151_9RHOB|nr:hypothetical protein [Boseongicola sp. SB0664_bin_43]MYK31879.1 hypothetical protein [Boseongicola sp. SB0670_bin_30]